MDQIIMVACDLHDKTMLLKIACGREAAETVSFPNSSAGRKKLIVELFRRSRAARGARVVFAYEASGQGFGLFDELREVGFTCYVLAPYWHPPRSLARPSTGGARRTKRTPSRSYSCCGGMCWQATRCPACGCLIDRRATIAN
jgi:hypothetical protein